MMFGPFMHSELLYVGACVCCFFYSFPRFVSLSVIALCGFCLAVFFLLICGGKEREMFLMRVNTQP